MLNPSEINGRDEKIRTSDPKSPRPKSDGIQLFYKILFSVIKCYLISNAIKFTNPNGKIFVNILSKEETVEITVKDTGVGIEKQHLDYIFNRFYQKDKSLSRNAEGCGIGLSLIKSFVELHGGNISVESEINKGSIFKVVLPAKTIERQ